MIEELYLLARIAMHRVQESPESTPNRVRLQLLPKLRR